MSMSASRMIDLLTPAGRQAIVAQFDADRRAALDYHRQLTDLKERITANVREVDWAADVAPVIDAAMGHVSEAIDYSFMVTKRQQDLDMDLEDAGGVDDDLDAALHALIDARRATDDELARLSIMCSRLGQHCRDEITRQVFTPPPAAERADSTTDEEA
jgi:hypothetical protein